MSISDIPADDISDDIYKAIGKIVVYFAELEHQISYLVSVFVVYRGIPEQWYTIGEDVGEIIAVQLGFKNAMWLLQNVAKIKLNSGGLQLSELEGIISRAWKAEDDRNRIVHSRWFIYPGSTEAARTKTTARRQAKKQLEFMSVEELDSIADSIIELARDINKFIFRCHPELLGDL